MATKILQLKISLKRAKPPIWRRVLVDGSSSLADLHHVIQDAMGWCDCHLHSFDLPDGTRCSNPRFGLDEYGECIRDESKVTVQSVLKRSKQSLVYEYDFGDGWEHKVTLEKTLKGSEVKGDLPHCSAGRRACPPEDSGGVWGYEMKLETLAGPDCEERQELAEWFPEGFDAAKFDRGEVNEVLRQGWTSNPLLEEPADDKEHTPLLRVLAGG